MKKYFFHLSLPTWVFFFKEVVSLPHWKFERLTDSTCNDLFRLTVKTYAGYQRVKAFQVLHSFTFFFLMQKARK